MVRHEFDWEVDHHGDHITVWPADLPAVADRRSYGVHLTERDLDELKLRLRAQQLDMADRTGGL